MKFETPSVTKKTEENYSLDDPWYERFKDVAAFQDYELLEGNKQERSGQKDAFLSGKIENPDLGFPKLESFPLEKRERIILELKKTISENETNDILRKAYAWRINEKLAEVRMLKATKDGDDRKVAKYSRFIYGEPSKEVYEYTVSQLKALVDGNLYARDQKVADAAQRLNMELFDTLMTNESQIDPKEFHFPEMKPVKEDKQYTAEEIKEAFEGALRRYEIDGWKVIVDTESSASGVSTSQEKKTIIIPHTRKIKETYLKSLIEHEIGTHVIRREHGERSSLRLLGLGLDRNLRGEEGIATYREQQIEGAKNFSGLESHLAISLALGLDGKKRDFRQTFEIMRDFYFIRSSNKDKAEAWKSAENSAWDRCVRVFRGTTCHTPGACLTRDLVYREGNIGVWNIIRNNPDEEKRFAIGKYDPANPRHIWILEQLGITEEDLDQLEK